MMTAQRVRPLTWYDRAREATHEEKKPEEGMLEYRARLGRAYALHLAMKHMGEDGKDFLQSLSEARG